MLSKVYVGETLHLVVSIANTSNERIKAADIRVIQQILLQISNNWYLQADLLIEKDPNASHQQSLSRDAKNLKTFYKEDIRPMDPMTFSLEFKVDQPYTYL